MYTTSLATQIRPSSKYVAKTTWGNLLTPPSGQSKNKYIHILFILDIAPQGKNWWVFAPQGKNI